MVLTFYNSLRRRSVERGKKVVNQSILFFTVVIFVIGFFGFTAYVPSGRNYDDDDHVHGHKDGDNDHDNDFRINIFSEVKECSQQVSERRDKLKTCKRR